MHSTKKTFILLKEIFQYLKSKITAFTTFRLPAKLLRKRSLIQSKCSKSLALANIIPSFKFQAKSPFSRKILLSNRYLIRIQINRMALVTCIKVLFQLNATLKLSKLRYINRLAIMRTKKSSVIMIKNLRKVLAKRMSQIRVPKYLTWRMEFFSQNLAKLIKFQDKKAILSSKQIYNKRILSRLKM